MDNRTFYFVFFFSSRRRHTRSLRDWSSDVCSSDLAKLAGGVAVIKVGAATEVELKEKKHRIEDALSTTRAAVEEGLVAGGGTTLLQDIPSLDKLKLDGDEQVGVDIVRKALEAPARQIADNAGAPGEVIAAMVLMTETIVTDTLEKEKNGAGGGHDHGGGMYF